jgi:hypothetical protein
MKTLLAYMETFSMLQIFYNGNEDIFTSADAKHSPKLIHKNCTKTDKRTKSFMFTAYKIFQLASKFPFAY